MTKLTRIEKVVVLQSADLFAFCKAEQVLRFAAIAYERHVRAGETIYAANDPAGELYCVVHGDVRLERPSGAVRHAGPLKTFGETEILSGRLRCTTATAETDTLVLTIGAEDFFDLLAGNIEIVKALFRQILENHPENADS